MGGMLEGALGSRALCWRIERRDGAALGFTTHDRDLGIEGLVYRAAPGMLPSAISLGDGFDAEALEVTGALTADAIRAADLKAGRWDGAAVAIFAVDWSDPEGARLPLATGEIGEIAVRGRSFEAELKGAAAALDRPVVELTSPECRARLGDRRCRVDMAGRRRMLRVTAVTPSGALALDGADARHVAGRLRWLDGANAGWSAIIAAVEDGLVTLRDAPPFAAVAGELVDLSEGCDRSFATCTGRFANGANFRGEPHLPGLDLLTRYPGA
jgi:uncharacterized phage protein (TIGR02218 family)